MNNYESKSEEGFPNLDSDPVSRLLLAQFLHSYKNELLSIISALQKSQKSSPGVMHRIVSEQIEWMKKRVNAISLYIEQDTIDKLDINVLIDDVVRYMSQFSNFVDIIFVPHIGIPVIEAKEADIREIVLQLVSNAVSSIEEKGEQKGIVKVSTMITDGRIRYIQILVEDDGIGIDKDARVFDGAVSTWSGRPGMGLYLAKKLVRSYGGKVFYESTPGVGSKFFVHLPLKRLQADEV